MLMSDTSGNSNNGSLALLERASEFPLLTPPEELALAKRVERGDRAALERMLLSNLRLVAFIARRYRGQGVPLEDLVQEGIVGLSRAVEKFDHRKGHRFSTYATWWIRQACQRAVSNQGRTIRLPVHVGQRRRKLTRAREDYRRAWCREPTIGVLADAASIDPKRAHEAIDAAEAVTSLNKPVGESETELGDLLADTRSNSGDDENAPDSQALAVRSALEDLPHEQRSVIALRFGLADGPRTQEEIAKILRTSPRRIRILERDALQALQELLAPRKAAYNPRCRGPGRGRLPERSLPLPWTPRPIPTIRPARGEGEMSFSDMATDKFG
jgi:RNA polymerase primary sigma factor